MKRREFLLTASLMPFAGTFVLQAKEESPIVERRSKAVASHPKYRGWLYVKYEFIATPAWIDDVWIPYMVGIGQESKAFAPEILDLRSSFVLSGHRRRREGSDYRLILVGMVDRPSGWVANAMFKPGFSFGPHSAKADWVEKQYQSHEMACDSLRSLDAPAEQYVEERIRVIRRLTGVMQIGTLYSATPFILPREVA